MKRIIVAANGPSAYCEEFKKYCDETLLMDSKTFRTNYFYLNDGDPLGYNVTDWFICEDVGDCRAVRGFMRGHHTASSDYMGGYPFAMHEKPTIWLPGINKRMIDEIDQNHLNGYDIRLQREFSRLPDACRWDKDLAPERPLMGSFALAVAVGFQPEEIVLAGHDLFSHPSGFSHAGTEKETRNWQTDFNSQYLGCVHRNHRISGDLKYIKAALSAYRGKVVSFGTPLKRFIADEFTEHMFIDG